MSKTFKVRAGSLDTAMRRAKVQFGPDAMIVDTRHLRLKDPDRLGMTEVVELLVEPGHRSNHGEPDQRLARTSDVIEVSAGTKSVEQLQSEISRIDGLIRSVVNTERKLRQVDDHYPLGNGLLGAGVSTGSVRMLQSSFEEHVPASERDNRKEAERHLARYLRCVRAENIKDISGTHLFLGSAGCGKTTLVIKLASALAQGGKNVAVIVAAPYHSGEVRRIEAVASAIMIDAAVARDVADLRRALQVYNDKDVVLIDTPCWLSSKRDGAMKILTDLRSDDNIYKHYVCSLTNDFQFVVDELNLFESWACDFVAVTKLDMGRHMGKIVDLAMTRQLIFSLLASESADVAGIDVASERKLLDMVLPEPTVSSVATKVSDS